MSKKVRNSVAMAGDVMHVIKNLARDMHEQVNMNKKKEISKKVDNVLSKMQKDAERINNRKKESILDIDLLSFSIKKEQTKLENKVNLMEIKNLKEEESQNTSLTAEEVKNEKNPFSKRETESKKQMTFYEKQLEYLSQHEMKMNHRKQEKLEQEKETMKTKPDISKNSIAILKKKNRMSSSMTKFNKTTTMNNENENETEMNKNTASTKEAYKPFYLRSQEVYREQEERKEKLKQMYEMVNRAKEERKSHNTLVVKPYNEEDFEKWRKEKINWKNKRDDKLIKIKKDLNNKELGEEYSFTPEINENSNKLVSDKFQNSGFYDREPHYKEHKMNQKKKIENELNPNFTPLIMKELPNYVRPEKVKEFKNKSQSVGKIYLVQPENPQEEEFKEEVIPPAKEIKEYDSKKAMISKMNNSQTVESPNKSNYYNLNVRDNSAWNENKENCVVLNSLKYTDIIGKLAGNENKKDEVSFNRKDSNRVSKSILNLSLNPWK